MLSNPSSVFAVSCLFFYGLADARLVGSLEHGFKLERKHVQLAARQQTSGSRTRNGTLTSAEGCTEYHLVVQGDTCYGLSMRYSFQPWDLLRDWNTDLDSLCYNLWTGYQYCVAGPQRGAPPVKSTISTSEAEDLQTLTSYLTGNDPIQWSSSSTSSNSVPSVTVWSPSGQPAPPSSTDEEWYPVKPTTSTSSSSQRSSSSRRQSSSTRRSTSSKAASSSKATSSSRNLSSLSSKGGSSTSSSSVMPQPTSTSTWTTGQATWFITGLGACGRYNTDSDYIAAVSHYVFDSWPGATANPNLNPICGQVIEAKTSTGKMVNVTVVDRCADCPAANIDLTQTAFQELAPLSAGRIPIQWRWVGNDL